MTQGGQHYASSNRQYIRFVQCLDTESSPASFYYFPGQSRATPAKDAWLIKNKLSPALTRTHLATPTWSCYQCANVNRSALNAMLERLRTEGRDTALRRVVATGGDGTRLYRDLSNQERLARREAIASLQEPVGAVTLRVAPWAGMRRCIYEYPSWRSLPDAGFARWL